MFSKSVKLTNDITYIVHIFDISMSFAMNSSTPITPRGYNRTYSYGGRGSGFARFFNILFSKK